jgi:plasmid stabilization system protein ParE
MMRYRVVVEPEAMEDIGNAYLWIAAHSPAAAVRWFNGLTAARDSLQQVPRRCPVVPELSAPTLEIRKLLYGRRRNVYQILFTIREDTAHILHVRHGARAPMRAKARSR